MGDFLKQVAAATIGCLAAMTIGTVVAKKAADIKIKKLLSEKPAEPANSVESPVTAPEEQLKAETQDPADAATAQA